MEQRLMHYNFLVDFSVSRNNCCKWGIYFNCYLRSLQMKMNSKIKEGLGTLQLHYRWDCFWGWSIIYYCYHNGNYYRLNCLDIILFLQISILFKSMKIKSVYVGLYNNEGKTFTFSRENNKKMKADLQILPNKLKALNAKAGERNKLKTQYGSWYVMHKNGWAYGICTNQEYPQRHAYGFIQKINDFLTKNNPADAKFSKQLKKFVDENIDKYEDLQKIDKVQKAQKEVNMLQSDLNTGIKKLINNQQNLSQLDGRAAQMKNLAKQFQTNCQKVQSITFWHKWKMILIVIAIVLGAIALIAVSIMVKI